METSAGEIGNEVYALTRVGFGLSSAPRIMTVILRPVLAKKEEINTSTSSFMDEILVNLLEVSTTVVPKHLKH